MMIIFFGSAFVRLNLWVCSLGLLLSMQVLAQTTESDLLTQARVAIGKQEWSKAESIIRPIAQNQPQNPFALYELAQIYENTNRIEAAKQLYLDLTSNPEFIQRQPTLVIRAPYSSKMVYILSLSQARLNAIAVKQLDTSPSPLSSSVVAQTSAVTPWTPGIVASNATPVIANPDQQTAVQSAITMAVGAWAESWGKKDLPRYFASYVENFRGDFQTSEAWKQQRQMSILNAVNIKIDLKNITATTQSPTNARVTFMQLYQSNSFKNIEQKTLVLNSKNGRWLIERETSK